VVDCNPPLTGTTILSYLASSSEIPIRAPIRALLGKVHRYIGGGRDPVVDRVFVREKIKEVVRQYQYLITTIEVKVPASVLREGRKEIVILSGIYHPQLPLNLIIVLIHFLPDSTAHSHVRSAHIIQTINTADMLMLAVDSNGLTNELASLLYNSRFSAKLSKDHSKVMILDLSERSEKMKGNNSQRAGPIKDHLISQFKRLYRDAFVDSPAQRNALANTFSKMEVLTVKVLPSSSHVSFS
jgi:hypothetical protein